MTTAGVVTGAGCTTEERFAWEVAKGLKAVLPAATVALDGKMLDGREMLFVVEAC